MQLCTKDAEQLSHMFLLQNMKALNVKKKAKLTTWLCSEVEAEMSHLFVVW